MASNRPDSSSGSTSGPEETLFNRAHKSLLNKMEEAAADIRVQEQAELAVLRRQPRTAQSAPSAIPEDGSSSLEDLDSYDDSSQDKTIEYGCLTGASSEERRERRSERSKRKRKLTPQPAKKTGFHSSKSIFYIFIIILI